MKLTFISTGYPYPILPSLPALHLVKDSREYLVFLCANAVIPIPGFNARSTSNEIFIISMKQLFTDRFFSALLPVLVIVFFVGSTGGSYAQDSTFTRADTLRGTLTPERAWWEVVFYDLNVSIMPEDSTIHGSNEITYRIIGDPRDMQIDLQDPLEIDTIIQDGEPLSFRRDSNAFFIEMPENLEKGALYTIRIEYGGKPKVAENPPWDGGFIWARDSEGNRWVATANQGLGASVWWPNKDHQTAEPDSMRTSITVPDPMINVSNGRLEGKTDNGDGTTTWTWFVSHPINNYNIAVNAGNYVNFTDTFDGEDGTLDLSYWVLERNLEKAREQFQQVKPMLSCFEEWFGPYPFYEDSFKMVETPHLGMEHQSAVAYGNQYQNGYLGRDLSGTGWGLKWDFIIIHEAAHEWWGNNITTEDIADMWVHEGFTSYSEGIYVECRFGKEAGAEYIRGLRNGIQNRAPVTGSYGLNNRGSGDMYPKANNMLHTIRQIVDNDTTWKRLLRGLNETFRHQTVSADRVERYIIEQTGKDLDDIFDQYLHYTELPVFEYYIDELNRLHYRWKANIPHFNMPLKISTDGEIREFIYPVSDRWRTTRPGFLKTDTVETDPDFYIWINRLDSSPPEK